jgi:mono/diheme cytochrome c family protein
MFLDSARCNPNFLTGSHQVFGWTKEKKSMWRKRAARFLVVLTLLVSTGINGAAADETKHPWQAPEPAVKVKNPVKTTPEGLTAAARLYRQNCVICHGKTGASNGPAASSLPQKPANFTDASMMRKATDGELFWKMSTGRAPMPSWQDKLSETERWQLVNYLRTLTRRGEYKYLGIGKAD